jgi:hypothetical protein
MTHFVQSVVLEFISTRTIFLNNLLKAGLSILLEIYPIAVWLTFNTQILDFHGSGQICQTRTWIRHFKERVIVDFTTGLSTTPEIFFPSKKILKKIFLTFPLNGFH